MAQVKIYGLKSHLDPIRAELSDAIHHCMVRALALPTEKRFHRFIALEEADFIYPADCSPHYTILEISMFEGRSSETKKDLIRQLFDQLDEQIGILPQDLEITIFETPRHNWGIRGQPGDELDLNYRVDV